MEKKNNINTKIVSILAIVAIILSVASFFKTGNNGGSESNNTLAKILRTKVMSVCVVEWPPASIKDAKTGKYSGHDVDAYEAIAKEIGATVQYHDTTFGDMPAALQSGVCDMGTSLYVKTSRAAAVDFTRPILYAGDAALVKKGDTRFKAVDDINQPGIKVAVATGESGHIFAKTNLSKATIIPIDVEASDISRFMLEVTSGRADIAVSDASTIATFAANHPETEMIFKETPLDLNADAFTVRLGDTQLLDFLNNSILSMQVDGTWDKIESKYNAHWFHTKVEYMVK